MIEKITLRLFWIFMILCATTILLIIWFTDGPAEWQAKLAATFFIFGFANFLIWGPTMVKKFYKAIAEKG